MTSSGTSSHDSTSSITDVHDIRALTSTGPILVVAAGARGRPERPEERPVDR